MELVPQNVPVTGAALRACRKARPLFINSAGLKENTHSFLPPFSPVTVKA